MRGIDISHYDGFPFKPDTAEAYVDSDFVIVKATQGTSYKYVEYFEKAINKVFLDGKLAGAYHYAAGNDPELEADYFISVVKPYLGSIVLALDWEKDQNVAWGNKQWCKRFIDRVKKQTGLTCLLYTGMDGIAQNKVLANVVPLWFAGYPQDKNSWAIPKFPSYYRLEPWNGYTIWQFTSGKDKLDRNCTSLSAGKWELLAMTGERHGYAGDFPQLPSRGYYRTGDGITALIGKRNQIKKLQKLINWITGANLVVDGKYGKLTAAAVAKAQNALGVTVDGLFGEKTLEAAKNFVM